MGENFTPGVGGDFAKCWGQTLVRNIRHDIFFQLGHDILLTKLGRTFFWNMPQRLAGGRLRFLQNFGAHISTENGAGLLFSKRARHFLTKLGRTFLWTIPQRVVRA